MNIRQTQKTVCPAAYFDSYWNILTEILLPFYLWRTRDSRCACCLLLNEPFRKRADSFPHLLFKLISFCSWTICLLSPENAFILYTFGVFNNLVLAGCANWRRKGREGPKKLPKSPFRNVCRAVRGAELGFNKTTATWELSVVLDQI